MGFGYKSHGRSKRVVGPLGDVTPVAWFLYAMAAIYLLLFAAFFVTFWRLERRATRMGDAAVAAYNRALRGFPNGFYAKMMGYKPR